MTDKINDWADEIAAQLWCKPEHEHKIMDCEFAASIAAALCKARADGEAIGERRGRAAGMREASDIVKQSKGYTRNAEKPWAEDIPASKEQLAAEIHAQADKIERGEA
jgi:hypothetical protein